MTIYSVMRLKILADAMGLGKTIMTISLMLTCSDKGGSYASSASQPSTATDDMSTSGQSPGTPKNVANISSFGKLMQCRQPFIGGGSLIICPMTLLGQWKVMLSCFFCKFFVFLHDTQPINSVFVRASQSACLVP